MATRIQGKKITDLGGGYALLTERSGFTGDLLYYPLEQSIGQDGKPFWHKIYGSSWGTPEFSMYKRASIIAYIKKLKQGKKSNPSSLKVKAGEWIPCHAVRLKGGKLEIMKDALANKGKSRISNPQQINLFHAKEIFRQIGAKVSSDYYELTSSQLSELRDLPEYKKFKTSGAKSKGRAFIDKLNRIIDKG